MVVSRSPRSGSWAKSWRRRSRRPSVSKWACSACQADEAMRSMAANLRRQCPPELSPCKKRTMAGIAAGSCMKKMCPPSKRARRAPGMAPARNSLLAGGAIPSKRPPHTKRGAADGVQPSSGVVVAACLELEPGARPGQTRIVLPVHARADQADHVGDGRRARRRPSGCR